MSEFSCNTVRDMLPLYVDNIVSDDTRAIVEEHLTSCDACRKEYENMKNAFVLPADGDAKQLKRFKGAWKKKKRLVALTAVIATILALCIQRRDCGQWRSLCSESRNGIGDPGGQCRVGLSQKHLTQKYRKSHGGLLRHKS